MERNIIDQMFPAEATLECLHTSPLCDVHVLYQRMCDRLRMSVPHDGESAGERIYLHIPDDNDPGGMRFVAGAVVLWNPEGYDSEPFNDDESLRALDMRWQQKLQTGTHAEHYLRACSIARNLCDGAYLALTRLHADGLLSCSGWCMDPETASGFIMTLQDSRCIALVRAEKRSDPTYAQLRDYMINEENVYPLVAMQVAAYFTRDQYR